MRYLVPIVLVLALIGGLVGIKFMQISSLIKMGEAAAKSGPPPEVVGTTVAAPAAWENSIPTVGNVAVARGVAVSSEAAGKVTAIRFDSGQPVRAGQVLVELDTSVERAQLASVTARKELATVSTERSRQLANSAAISKAQLDNDEAQLKTTAADLAALQAQIDRKTIRAPFSGRVGIRSINLGQYLNPGTTITTLESLEGIYVDFSLPQQELANVRVGTPVVITFSDKPGELKGAVAAVDPGIDPITRSIKLRASVTAGQGKDELRPGMFVKVAVAVGVPKPVVVAPTVAVVRASYGDSVFVVEDKVDDKGAVVKGEDGKPQKMARQQFVRLGAQRGDFVAILDGVKAGQELVTEGAFKLRNKSGVVVNNTVKPKASETPAVENH